MKIEYIKLGNAYLNDNKDKTGKQPDFRGNLKLEEGLPKGTDLLLAAWKNDGHIFVAASYAEEKDDK